MKRWVRLRDSDEIHIMSLEFQDRTETCLCGESLQLVGEILSEKPQGIAFCENCIETEERMRR